MDAKTQNTQTKQCFYRYPPPPCVHCSSPLVHVRMHHLSEHDTVRENRRIVRYAKSKKYSVFKKGSKVKVME